jgi:hypothetical protein
MKSKPDSKSSAILCIKTMFCKSISFVSFDIKMKLIGRFLIPLINFQLISLFDKLTKAIAFALDFGK